jgi:hypothetical protein
VFPVRYELNIYFILPTECICVFRIVLNNKQRLFPQTALTGLSLYRERTVFPVRYELDFYMPCKRCKKKSGRESQVAWRQDELIGDKPPVVE